MSIHYTDRYLLNPPHKVTIDLVGMGGTGSQVINGLARMNMALMALGHPGLHVRCFDEDIVSHANIGRQLFSASDIGVNKAIVLVTRINRYFGYEWEAVPEFYVGKSFSNITITCVDSAKARLMIGMRIEGNKKKKGQPTDRPVYWLDLGNLQKTGQVVLGTIHPVDQPKGENFMSAISYLPTVTKKFPELMKIVEKEDDLGPSCSLAEALTKQDMFINSTLAQFGCNLIWKLFREGMIKHHGCYVNLDSCIVNPIKIPDGRKLETNRPANNRKGAGGNKRKAGKGNKKSAKGRVPVRSKNVAPVQSVARRNKSTARKKKVRAKSKPRRS